MIVLKSESDLARMRESGQIAAKVRDAAAKAIAPGVTTGEIADFAVGLIKGYGGQSAFFGYRGYPGQICISLNDEVVHGIPGKRRIELGDIVSIDIGVAYGGFIGDTATTVMVGVGDQQVIKLVKTTEAALMAGIKAAVVGRRICDISRAIESVALKAGFSVVRQFVGHGVGRKVHEDPEVPNFWDGGHREKLKAGMTLAIEPMVNMGGPEVDVLDDGWTARTRDGKQSAHFEHTIAVGEKGVEILTA